MLAPKASIEYKYRLDKGEALLYSWTTATPVNYEFHAEPDGAPGGYAQSYEKSSGTGQNGTLTACSPVSTGGTGGMRATNRSPRSSTSGFYNWRTNSTRMDR